MEDERINARLNGRNFIPYIGLREYCNRTGLYSPNEKRDITLRTATNILGLTLYNSAIFGTVFASGILGLAKLVDNFS